MAAQYKTGVGIAHHKGNLLGPFHDVTMTQEIQRAPGRAQFIAHCGLIDARRKRGGLGNRPAAGVRVRAPVTAADAVQRALVGGQFGVAQADRVVAHQHVELIAAHRQVEAALRLGVVDDRAVVSVHRVNRIRVDVGQEPAIVGLVEAGEQVRELALAGVER